jgi:two-component system sensor histidine kinase KdpD
MQKRFTARWRESILKRDSLALILPWLSPLVATLLSWPLRPLLPHANLSMLYLAGVLLTAMTTRVRPALVCAILSFLTYNFVHTEPQFTLFMVHREDILTGSLLMLVALVTGHLAANLNEKVQALQASHLWNQHQMALAQALSLCVDAPQVLCTLADQLQRDLQRPAYPLLRGDRGQDLRPLIPVPAELQAQISQAVQDVAGARDIELKRYQGHYLLCFYQDGNCQGLIVVEGQTDLPARLQERLAAFIQLTRLAWSRIQLAHTLQQETLIKEREQLRSALLSSISHDLRTPLAIMIGSVSSLIELDSALSPEQKSELQLSTLNEARRLDGYIQKLLDMTKLGHGELKLERDWIGLDDILSVVLKRARPLAQSVRLDVEVPTDLPLLHVHPTLIEQALFNVVENSLRYAPADSQVRISAAVDGTQLHIDVRDQGPGIPESSWQDIFDMFFSLSHGDQYPSGTGLGLAICQGIVGAHGGEARVLFSRPGETVIRLSLPLSESTQAIRSPDETHSDH